MVEVVRQTDEKLRDLERTLMAHRYLYYVLCDPYLADYEYDVLDKEFMDIVGREGKSPLHYPGSELSKSYSEDEISLAMSLKGY